jgi:hypothetical protein
VAPALLAAPATGHLVLQSPVSWRDGRHDDLRELPAPPAIIERTTDRGAAEIGTLSRRADALLRGTGGSRLLNRVAKRLRESDVELAKTSAQRVSAPGRLAFDGVRARAPGDVGCVPSTP